MLSLAPLSMVGLRALRHLIVDGLAVLGLMPAAEAPCALVVSSVHACFASGGRIRQA